MRRYIAFVAAAAAFAGNAGTAAAAPVCHEDEPCWNWFADGNGQRGWTDAWGNVHVGGACAFSRAIHSHRVFRYRATQKMKGDYSARVFALANCRHSR